MPVTPTYPGVYIEELPSGVRTITGVATSIIAFIGRALRGPVDEPVSIFNFGDFERQFGGLWAESMMSYAVRDFYLNGGSQAIIVRVHNKASTARMTLPTEVSSPPSPIPPGDNLWLDAASPGGWGSNLSALVNYQTGDPTAPPTSPPTATDPELFNLVITEKVGESVRAEERYLAVGSALHVMLAKRFHATVDQKRFPRQRRSTESDGHQRCVSTVSVSQAQEKWPHPQRQTEPSMP